MQVVALAAGVVSIWLYAYWKGLYWAREMARQMEHKPGLQWLTSINHHTLSNFRVGHGEALRELFVEVLALLTKNELIYLERVAKSPRSKQRSGNKRRGCALAAEALAQCVGADFGAVGGVRVPRRGGAPTKSAPASRAASERAVPGASASRSRGCKRRRRPTGVSRSKLRRRTPRRASYALATTALAPAYNLQLAADEEHGFIVDDETVDDPQDATQVPAAMERIKTNLGRYPEQALADATLIIRR